MERTKVCTHCSRELPVSQFGRMYRYNKKNERVPKGWRSRCNQCKGQADKAREKRKRASRVRLNLQLRHSKKEQAARIKQENQRLRQARRDAKNLKVCCRCFQAFPRTEAFFHRKTNKTNRGSQGGWSRTCKKCEHLKGISRPSVFRLRIKQACETRDKQSIDELKTQYASKPTGVVSGNYNIGAQEVLDAVLIQDFGCAICHKTFSDVPFVIDHDHETFVFRGLLCRQCNLMLGHAQDSRDILYQAWLYLVRFVDFS